MDNKRSEENFAKGIYASEIVESIYKLEQDVSFIELEYFFNVARNYFFQKRESKVIVLGNSFPEEIIYGLNEKPFWIVGGSLGTYNFADEFVPRDSDSVNQSILGFLKREDLRISSDSIIIVPVTCDSMRKISYMLKNEFNVITVDFPSNKDEKVSEEKWTSEMWRVAEKLETLLGKSMTRIGLKSAVKKVNKAREEMRRFKNITRMNKSSISTVLSLFILNTYYYTNDIVEWTAELKKVNDKLNKTVTEIDYETPNVLLLGSPIYFPNYKIPFLLNDIGLNIGDTVNVMTEKINAISNTKDSSIFLRSYFNKVVLQTYYTDCSTAYVDNAYLFENIKQLYYDNEFDGVIYHVLKGQIEYDFELNRYESFFVEQGIPVFRLETDYKYQDIEQIRIRVEAFKEMLVQNKYKQERCN